VIGHARRAERPVRGTASWWHESGCGLAGVTFGGIGLLLLVLGLHVPATPPPSAPASGPIAHSMTRIAAPGQTDRPALPDPLPPSVPVHLDIPRVGIHSELIPLGLNPDGTVMVPPVESRAPAGWYRYLSSPGEPGPAVLLGHVDSHAGPAVFYRLGALEAADTISVRRSDGRTAVFTVESVHIYPKSAFPAETIYGQTAEPVLRLITCGGTFDHVRRTYLSNVVVYATLITWLP
jgi:hypothetical protein